MATNQAGVESPDDESIFQSKLPLKEKLDRARTELLDLSARNRLLNMPRSSKGSRAVEIVDEVSAEVFRLLVREGRPFTFLAGKAAAAETSMDDAEDADEIRDLAQPEDDVADERGVQSRHADTRLQTRLTPKGLQKRLLELYFDARTLEEEQGVNILYLTLGALKWIDPQNAANIRYAPLVLVPVSLERGNAGEKFKLRVRQDDYASNLSLEAFLDRTQGIRLPVFEAGDGFNVAAYFEEIADAVAAKPGWEVLPDSMVLGFFSFAKFLMYRDLDPANWPAGGRITDRPLVRGLLAEGFEGSGDMIPEDANIDPFIPPAEMLHILDSDSSQALAIHEVRRGRDMVIQGPPGTGKSQTIANIVASAVADGKTVLFVAEKMAALEVVKRRLDATGVGDACLELHSSKANKRGLLEELRRTWELGSPKGQDAGTLNARLLTARDRLNAHARRMHEPHSKSGLTPYQVVGQLSRLRLDGERPSDVRLDDAERWSADDFAERHDVVSELVARIGVIGRPDDHLWRGVGLASIVPTDVERLVERLRTLADELSTIDDDQARLAERLEAARPQQMADADPLIALAMRVATAPDLAPAALASPAWDVEAPAVAALLEHGLRFRHLRSELAEAMTPAAWDADLGETMEALALLPPTFGASAFEDLRSAAETLPRLLAEAASLARLVGRDAPTDAAAIDRLVLVAERVSAAPDASAEAFASDLWDDGVERAGDVALAVAELEAARGTVGGGLTDAAWNLDLSHARGVLASHGTSFTRFFSGEWRRANKLVRSVLSRPDAGPDEVLSLLDALARGQAAKRSLVAEATFAASAFGADWRGERSASAPLLALVEWMRSLRGLGAEPRIIAARRPDRAGIGSKAAATARSLEDATALLDRMWHDIGDFRQGLFADAPDALHANLPSIAATTSRLHRADVASSALFRVAPDDLEERRRLLRQLDAGQRMLRLVEEGAPLGRAAFDAAWLGVETDWDALTNAVRWIEGNADIRLLASRLVDRTAPATLARSVTAARWDFLERFAAEVGFLRLDAAYALGQADPSLLDIRDLHARLTAWIAGGEQLSQWVFYRDRAEQGKALGCGDVVARLADGRLEPALGVAGFEMAYYEAVYADLVDAQPELGRFDGTLHGRLAREFAEMDGQRIVAASLEVARAHHGRVPARDGGAAGPLGVLRSEIARKRGHMPIRRLMENAGPAVQALKPVFMMSPLSVAQFLAPGAFEFDLLVMDEASQIQPVDALGAVARAKQVVVVGDPKQLPPTAFFSKMTSGGSDEEEDAGGRVADIESILGLFTARGLPMRMLRWHYRSKHQSLIAVSNRQFYENKLFIVPSPYTAEAGMGLRFHHIPQGIFDAGATRTNMVEARIVAQAIVTHAREHGDLSLGVAAFSAAQRRAILDQLELLRRNLAPEVEAFFQAHHSEPFFVKNLENVQGDERDVIFISVGYGSTVPGGRVPMRFGPLGSDGGERRLNVLISRAKQRCEVFASMTDEDIDPDFAATRKGVLAFRIFLHFARTGKMTLAESTGRDHDSVFEEQIARALQEKGYQVHRQVGLAGFFIDLAVADADRPGRYLLGIECDGASYHDARSARDRDRLRQSVLESHGWSIHRVWSTDWFQRPNEQLELIIARIEAAKLEHDALAAGRKAHRAVPYDIVAIEREDVTEIGLAAAEEPKPPRLYEEAVVSRPDHIVCDIHEAPRGIISALAEKVVDVEGPVHVDEVVGRIRSAWGLKRAGGRIHEAVEIAVEVSVRTGRLRRDGDFLSLPDRQPRIRDRSAVTSLTLRRCEALPPAEIELAVLDVVRTNFGATDEQIGLAVSRAIGFKSTSGQLRELISGITAAAIGKKWLERRNGMLVEGPQAPVAPKPVRPPSPLLDLIAQGEHEALEFKETLRWDVALQAPNRKLEDVVVKTLAGFANRVGGTLLVGVADDGTIQGLERDFAALGGTQDKMQLHLTNLVTNHFGQAYRASRVRIGFPEEDGKVVCRIDVEPSPSAVFVKLVDARGQSCERFYVRSGNSTQDLSPSETAAYIRGHFNA
ncbi:DUF3320 domain-containing protein [Sphingomonas sp. RIT328]|uniref:DUF3320 domain-containing protein n=1 Tax=Sphingomonas sp. RIT328 TaxID=1470591 RepID=UPI000450B3F4|nr:DUF3320 domain-containing protein [Sphingomonas sp. RIT328]EZP50038.1 Superfamily I DNA and RNA helicase protein [Sphingomonas sp. RIT328]